MYKVTLAPRVAKGLRRLSRKNRKKLIEASWDLREFPRKGNIKQLGGRFGHFRLRVGKWRYIFWVDKRNRLIRITKLDTRGDVYK